MCATDVKPSRSDGPPTEQLEHHGVSPDTLYLSPAALRLLPQLMHPFILRQILLQFPTSNLRTVMRINREMYDAAAPLLYRHLRYFTGTCTGDEDRIDPFVGVFIPDGRITRSRAGDPCGNLKRRLLGYTEHLQIGFHMMAPLNRRCCNRGVGPVQAQELELDLPNVLTLELYGSSTCDAGLDCPLISRARPKLLIFDLHQLTGARQGHGRRPPELHAGKALRYTPHIVYIVDYEHPTFQQNQHEYDDKDWSGFEQTPATQSVTLLVRFPPFQTPFKLPHGIHKGIAKFCAGYSSIPITVVGVDELEIWSDEPVVPKLKSAAYVAACQVKVEKKLSKLVEDVPRRMEHIYLQTADEYAKRNPSLMGLDVREIVPRPARY